MLNLVSVLTSGLPVFCPSTHGQIYISFLLCPNFGEPRSMFLINMPQKWKPLTSTIYHFQQLLSKRVSRVIPDAFGCQMPRCYQTTVLTAKCLANMVTVFIHLRWSQYKTKMVVDNRSSYSHEHPLFQMALVLKYSYQQDHGTGSKK